MSKETYEGFKNKETFELHIHFEDTFKSIKKDSSSIYLTTKSLRRLGIQSLEASFKSIITEYFETKFRQDEDDGNFDRMVYNLTQNFLQKVDWEGIAEKYIDME